MKSLLQQLREEQAANPPVAAPEAPAARLTLRADRGFCRIFPGSFKSIAEVPESFKAEHWNVPSPWCRIDGQPDHPEFESNRKST